MTAQVVPFVDTRASRMPQARGPRIVPLTLFVLAVVAVFFSMIFLRISLDETAFELASIERSIETEQSLQLDLRYDLATLRDPLRIASEAQRIGLVAPDTRVSIPVDFRGIEPQVLTVESPVRALVGTRP
jgi:hypothetical protein